MSFYISRELAPIFEPFILSGGTTIFPCYFSVSFYFSRQAFLAEDFYNYFYFLFAQLVCYERDFRLLVMSFVGERFVGVVIILILTLLATPIGV